MNTDFRFSLNATKITATVSVLLAAAAFGPAPVIAQTAPPVAIPYTINTIAGTGTASTTPTSGGLATAATVSSDLRAIAVDAQGDVYFADTGANVVREINASTGIITTVAGGASSVCSAHTDEAGDNCIAATQTKLNAPRGIALDKAGNLYIADYGYSLIHVVNKLTGYMTLVAGSVANTGTGGSKTYSGDNGKANVAGIDAARGVRVDNNGNIWICDTGNNVVREVNATTGIITTVIGSDANGTSPATAGFTGDGGPASGAELNEPTDIVFDSAGNAYVVDFNNKRIREVTATNGVITGSSTINTIIGNGLTPPTTAPVGPQPATTTALGDPTKIDIDAYGNLYFADSTESVVYFYDAATQNITIIAGEFGYAGTTTGFTVCTNNSDTLGDGCPATQALFYQGTSALGIAVDANNNLYISDPADARIREVTTNLSFPATATGQTVSQTVELHFTKLDSPASANGITIGAKPGDFAASGTTSNCTLNSDTTTNCVFTVSFDPIVPGVRTSPLLVSTTLLASRSFPLFGVGNGVLQTFDPGTASLVGAGLSTPHGQAYDAAGNLYIADTGHNRVVEINATTQVQTVFAGTGTAGNTGNGGLATAATLNAPAAVTVSPDGTVYIADTGNNVIRAVKPSTGFISLYAGGGTACGTLYDSQSGYLVIDSQGDGCPATQATLKSPAGLATDSFGNLFIADTGDNIIRRVDIKTGVINLYAGLISGASLCTGLSSPDAYGDGCGLTNASFSGPTGLAMDGVGNLFVADTGDNLIRKVSEGTGLVSKSAGNGQSVFTGDGGLATSASLNGPTAVAEDAAGDLYIADTGNDAVRVVSSGSGDISTLLGQGGTSGSAGGTGAASLLSFSAPAGLALDSSGDISLSDTGNSRVVYDNRQVGLLAFGSDNTMVTTPEQTATFTNIGNEALTYSNSPFYAATGSTTQFAIDVTASTACSGTGLTVSSSCTLAASFDPQTTGNFTENITVPSNAVNQGTAKVQLTGIGVQLASTKLTLVQTSPSGPISYGQSATFTATVAPTSGTGTPTGSVTFSVDLKPQSPSVMLSSSGTATFTITLPVGNHTIGASYSGDATYASSNSSISAPVSTAATTTSLTITPTTQIQLQPVTFTAQVNSTTIGVPTGSVNFMSGTTVLGTGSLNASGQATFTTSSLAIASYTVVAVYSGDANYATSSSSSQTLAIVPIPPNFSATAGSTTLTVPQGGTVQTQLNLVPVGGITGAVSFSCSGLPANTTCGFFPTTVALQTLTPSTDCTPNPSNAICDTMTITTNVPPVALSRLQSPSRGHALQVVSCALFLPMLLGMGLAGTKRKRVPGLMPALALLLTFGVMSGCTSNPTQTPAQLTPVGTSTVTVTMAGPNSVTKTVTITLNVLAATPVTAQATPPAAPVNRLYPASALSVTMLQGIVMMPRR